MLVVEEAGGWTPPSWSGGGGLKRSLVGPVARRQWGAAARAADVLESRLGPCRPIFFHSRYHLKISTNEFKISYFSSLNIKCILDL